MRLLPNNPLGGRSKQGGPQRVGEMESNMKLRMMGVFNTPK
ncbi:hypothetical protein Patl1_37663 [Pistacia atlantica]|nr:hypothetical protein Patl1_37663 [Pistacia atlantica]